MHDTNYRKTEIAQEVLERTGRLRRQRLRRYLRRTEPLFIDQKFYEAVNRNPEYFFPERHELG